MKDRTRRWMVGAGSLLAVAFASFSAQAATPKVEWDGDFLETTKGGYTLSANGHTVSPDGSSLTISGEKSVGATIGWSTICHAGTVIIRYANLPATLSGTGVLTIFGTDHSALDYVNYDGMAVLADGTLKAAWTDGTWGSPVAGLQSSGRFALRYVGSDYAPAGTDAGTYAWKCENGGTWTSIYSASGLRGSGSNFTKCSLGGPNGSSTKLGVIPGLTIEAVAVFDSALSEAEITAYQFPCDRTNEFVTSEIAAGTYDWNDLPWRYGRTPAFDDANAQIALKISGDVMLTNAPVALAAASLTVSGSGRLILPVGFDLASVGTRNISAGVILCYNGNSPTLEPPVPEVEWDRDFNVTTKGAYTLSANGNTVSADGTSITIADDSSVGAKINWASDWSAATVIIRYADLPDSADNGILTLFGKVRPDNIEYENYVGMAELSDGTFKAAWIDGFYGSAFPRVNASGHFALRYSDRSTSTVGTYAWKGESGIWTPIYSASGLLSAYSAITECSVGGPNAVSSNHRILPGLRIEAIALFRGVLTDAKIAAYKFPSERNDGYETEAVPAGSYAWADLPWKRVLVPEPDDTTAKVTVNVAGDVVLTDVSEIDVASLTVTGTGKLIFPSGVVFGANLAGSVATGASIASQSGPLTLDGAWEIRGTVDGAVRVEAPTSVAVYGGVLGSSLSGSGTVRFVGVMPGAEAQTSLTADAAWTGNCVLEDISGSQANLDLDLYGNANSKVTLKGVTGYFKKVEETGSPWIRPEVVLEDLPERVALNVNNVATSFSMAAKFGKLSGSGTFQETRNGGKTVYFLVNDGSDFHGSLLVDYCNFFAFGSKHFLPGSLQPHGTLYVPTGHDIDLDARSVVRGRLTEVDGTRGSVYICGALTATSRKSVQGVVTLDGGELTFDADKAGEVADATLTDCSACDFSDIGGTGTVAFVGTYAPFILPTVAWPSGLDVRIDAALQGNLTVTSEVGGSGTLSSGTLALGNGATLNRAWGTLAVANGAAVTVSADTLGVVADPEEIGKGDFMLLTGAGDFSGLANVVLKVVSPSGRRLGTYNVKVTADGVVAQRRGTVLFVR